MGDSVIYHSDAQNLGIMSRGKIQVKNTSNEILQHEYGDNFKAGNAINVCRCVEERVRLNSLLYQWQIRS